MKIYKGEDYERNLKICEVLLKAQETNKTNREVTVSGEALKLAYKYKITPQRILTIFKKYKERGLISQ